MTDADISIIILTKDAGEGFERVLSRLDDQTYDGDVETLVIDSGSSDATVERAREHGATVHEIEPERFHHSRTRNLGGDRASGDALVYLSQDASPANDRWLSAMIEPFDDDETSIVYGRQIAYPDADPMVSFFYSYFYPETRRRLTRSDVNDYREFYIDNVFLSDVSSAIRADVWDEVRFDPEVDMAEDKDFALRTLERGGSIVYNPLATVYHSHDYDLESLAKRRFKDGKAYTRIALPDGSSPVSDESQFLQSGFDYLTAEMSYLVENGHLKWVPYALLYESIHFLAFQCGKYSGKYRDSG